MDTQLLDRICQQASQHSRQLAVAGTPIAPNLPVAGAVITQEQIINVGQRGQRGRSYLTRAHRVSLFNQIHALDLPAKHQLQLRDIDDISLCSVWIQAHGWDFVKRAMDMWPKKPVIRERKYA